MLNYLMGILGYLTQNTDTWWRLNVWCFNRFHYAARIWDAVKKSSALSEYSRLLCWSFAWSAVAQRCAISWEKEATAIQKDVVICKQRPLQEEVDTTVSQLKLESRATHFSCWFGEMRRSPWRQLDRKLLGLWSRSEALVVVKAVLNENTFLSEFCFYFNLLQIWVTLEKTCKLCQIKYSFNVQCVVPAAPHFLWKISSPCVWMSFVIKNIHCCVILDKITSQQSRMKTQTCSICDTVHWCLNHYFNYIAFKISDISEHLTIQLWPNDPINMQPRINWKQRLLYLTEHAFYEPNFDIGL